MKHPQCHCGKIAYESPGAARVVLDRIRRRKKHRKTRSRIALELYRCEEGAWHLGRGFGEKRSTKTTRSDG